MIKRFTGLNANGETPMKRATAAGAVLVGVCLSAWAADAHFTLSSPDLPAGQRIGAQFTANAFGCHGANESPALAWKNAPPGTKSFALTMFDPYRPPASGWWHWVVYDIPATTTELPRKAGDPGSAGMPAGAHQVKPDGEAPEAHYYGPCPDEGDPPHHYTITVYALSVDHLNVPATSTAANIDYEISTKTLAKATLVRLYSRPKKSQ
jgi:Raf kinase inhibitor-like YbhB/YbcL family protein